MATKRKPYTETSLIARKSRDILGRATVLLMIAVLVTSSFVAFVTPVTADTPSVHSAESPSALAPDSASGTTVVPPEVEWTAEFGGLRFGSVVQASDGNYVGARPSSHGSRVGLVKTNADGNQIWGKSYDTGIGSGDFPTIIKTSDGGFAVTDGRNGRYLLKTDANGDKEWLYSIPHTTIGLEDVKDAIETSDGNYLLVGDNYNSTLGQEVARVTKVDAAGSELWSREFPELGSKSFATSTIEDNGKYVVSGYVRTSSQGSLPNEQGFLAKLNPVEGSLVPFSDGATIRYFGEESQFRYEDDYFIDIAIDGDSYLFAGYRDYTNLGRYEGWVVRASHDGIVTAEYKYDSGSTERFRSISKTSDGFILAGDLVGKGMYVVKTDESDTLQWNLRLDTEQLEVLGTPFGFDAISTNDGGYLVAGQSNGDLLVKLSPERVSTVDTPATGAVVNTATIDLTGTATSTESTVETVNVSDDGGATFAPATLDPDGSWSYQYTAAGEGTYTLDVKATDAAGAFDSEEVVVTVDTTPPTIDAISLDPALVEPEGSVAVSVTIAGPDDAAEVTANGVALDDANGDGIWTGTLTAPATDGSVPVAIVATDAAGNEATDSASYDVDATPPSVSLSAPATATETTVTVSGEATDANLASVELLVNGEPTPLSLADLAADGTFSIDATLVEGENALRLRAVDAVGNGNTTEQTVVVTLDADDDGLTNDEEAALGTDPNAADSDGDGIDDSAETDGGSAIDTDEDGTIDALDEDSDGDTIADADEGADDTDGDGTPDYRDLDADDGGATDEAEAAAGTDPYDATDDATLLDADGDGLSDAREGKLDTDPNNPDSDGDGLSDGTEVNQHGTDPLAADSDGDSLDDKAEIDMGTDPLKVDTDGDELNDGVDAHPLDPAADSDSDGLTDAAEILTHGTDPNNADTDGDGLSDGPEVNQHGTDPLKADSDGDGLSDSGEVNTHGTNPNNADTDGEGLSDGDEVAGGTDPNDPDTDGDGLSDGREGELGTDPQNPDTDGDGIEDGQEVADGTDPNDADDGGDDGGDGTGVFAEPLVVKGNEYRPQDPDGDGLYEDVDGDGAAVKGKDTSALAKIVNAYRKGDLSLTDAQIDALDFNGDGKLTDADNGAYNRSLKNGQKDKKGKKAKIRTEGARSSDRT